MADDGTVSTNVRLPKTLHERLKVASDERAVGMSLLAERAIETFLDRLPPVDDLLGITVRQQEAEALADPGASDG